MNAKSAVVHSLARMILRPPVVARSRLWCTYPMGFRWPRTWWCPVCVVFHASHAISTFDLQPRTCSIAFTLYYSVSGLLSCHTTLDKTQNPMRRPGSRFTPTQPPTLGPKTSAQRRPIATQRCRLAMYLFLASRQHYQRPGFLPATHTLTYARTCWVDAGELSNGMQYYVRPNRHPRERAELRIVIKVG